MFVLSCLVAIGDASLGTSSEARSLHWRDNCLRALSVSSSSAGGKDTIYSLDLH